MAEFINTIALLGDDAVIDSIIERTITEFKDDMITSVGSYAFYGCTALETVDLPNVTSLINGAFYDCTALSSVDLPNLKYISNEAFRGCTSLMHVNLPSLCGRVTGNIPGYTSSLYHGTRMFNDCTSLQKLVLPEYNGFETAMCLGCTALIDLRIPKATRYLGNQALIGCTSLQFLDAGFVPVIDQFALSKTSSLKIIILRSETVVTLAANAFNGSSLAVADSGVEIYVPRNLVSEYEVATNWCDRFAAGSCVFLPLEDCTVDGTTTGELLVGNVSYQLENVICSDTDTFVAGEYHATLSDYAGQPVSEVVITMNGINVTDSVYDPSTGEISIEPLTGDISIYAKAEYVIGCLYELPSPTTFNGTSDYIDTGIKLFDTEKSFTIICVAEFSKATSSNITLFHCMNEASPYPGLSADGSNGIRISYTGSSSLTTLISDRTKISALAIRYKNGVLDAIRYKNTSGEIVNVSHNTSAKYTAVTQNLLLGAYQTTAGVKGRYYSGTITTFKVFSSDLPDDILNTELLNA